MDKGATPIFDTYRNRFSFFSETGNYLILTKMKQKQRGNKLNILLIVLKTTLDNLIVDY